MTTDQKHKVHRYKVQNGLKPVPGIKNIIAVASGKGGVGKSTTAINLALALVQMGNRVGVLDADIYGPSQPTLLGLNAKPIVREDKLFEPIVKFGLQTMSMGYLVGEDSPTVWRGPMVSSALQQLLFGTAWDSLDYLIIDLPPGTGDIQLTLAQKIPVSGAVIITTPQDISLIDAKKALLMFQKLEIAILGIIENMSIHICSNCGQKDPIFGQGGGHRLSTDYSVPLLGQLPLNAKIREDADNGMPTVAYAPASEISQLYKEIANDMIIALSKQARDYSIETKVIEAE